MEIVREILSLSEGIDDFGQEGVGVTAGSVSDVLSPGKNGVAVCIKVLRGGIAIGVGRGGDLSYPLPAQQRRRVLTSPVTAQQPGSRDPAATLVIGFGNRFCHSGAAWPQVQIQPVFPRPLPVQLEVLPETSPDRNL